jgi:hypothetical protein
LAAYVFVACSVKFQQILHQTECFCGVDMPVVCMIYINQNFEKRILAFE